ncbi:MAG: hypothetical protein AABX11_01115 [Nanoarchaeota archaeon]
MSSKKIKLINKEALFRILKQKGISRISLEASDKLENSIINTTLSLILEAKQNMLIDGRHTLQAKDL